MSAGFHEHSRTVYLNDAQEKEPIVVALIAASGGGKSFIARNLAEEGRVSPVASWTTRNPRPNESDTIYDHKFVSEPVFDEAKRNGSFVITCSLYGNDYGLPALTRPNNGLPLMIAAKDCVIPDLRAAYPLTTVLHLESTDTPDQIAKHLLKRGQDKQDILERVARIEEENEAGRALADQVIEIEGHPGSVLNMVRQAVDLATHAHQQSPVPERVICIDEIVSSGQTFAAEQ